MRHNLTILLPVLALLASACGAVLGPTAQEATLQARNNELSTQITDLRATATVEVDRMMITVEHAQTEVRSVSQQRDGMRATQISRGTDATFFDANIPSESDLPSGVTPEGLIQPNLSGTTVQSAPPVTPPGGAPAASPAPNQAVGTPTPPPQSGPRLTNPTLTTAVGDDDCALNTSTSFPATTPEIYIVANAVDFPANTTVTTTWTREGEVMDSYDYTYDFAIENACIWSFIDQTDVAFTPGNWTVQLQLSTGGGVGPISFTVTGDNAAAAGSNGAAGAADAGAPTGAPTAMTEGQ
jgi:hypothetical protein